MSATPLHGLETASGEAIICIKNFIFWPGRGEKENPKGQCHWANTEEGGPSSGVMMDEAKQLRTDAGVG